MFFDVAICTPRGGPIFVIQIERNEWLEGPLWRVIVPNELLAGEETHITRIELVDLVDSIEGIQESVSVLAETLSRVSSRLKGPAVVGDALEPAATLDRITTTAQLGELTVDEVLELHGAHCRIRHERRGCLTCDLIAIRLGRV